MKKYLIIFILYLASNCSYGQSTEDKTLSKIGISMFYKPKNCSDTIYFGVLKNDSLIEIKGIYFHAKKNIYYSFVNDSIFEIGKFRKFDFIQCYRSSFVRMQKVKYWKSFNIKEESVKLIDNYANYNKRYIRLFPCFRIVLDKKE